MDSTLIQRGNTDPEKLRALIERVEIMKKMPKGIREEDLIKNSEDLSIDDIFIQHANKINQQLQDVIPAIRAQGESVFQKETLPSLTVLLHEIQVKQARDLAWLEQKTNIFENPAEKRMEQLK